LLGAIAAFAIGKPRRAAKAESAQKERLAEAA